MAGVPVGQHLTENALFTSGENPFRETGSLVAILATDAPLLPYQLKRLARRGAIGMARTGGMAGNGSGDLFLAFSTANPGAARPDGGVATIQALPNDRLDPLFMVAAYATEEAILNALLAAETMTGRDGLTVPALPHDHLQDLLRQYNRLVSLITHQDRPSRRAQDHHRPGGNPAIIDSAANGNAAAIRRPGCAPQRLVDSPLDRQPHPAIRLPHLQRAIRTRGRQPTPVRRPGNPAHPAAVPAQLAQQSPIGCVPQADQSILVGSGKLTAIR